jgi:CRP-like cAMP-binding protein
MNEMNIVIQTLAAISPLSDGAIRDLSAIMTERSVKKGAHLVRIGKKVDSFHYVVRGLARVYYLRDGEDVTDFFACDGEFIGAVPALFLGGPSQKGVEVLEHSTIIQFSYAAFEDLCTKHHDIERAGRKLAVYAFLEVQQRIENLRFMSVRERYEELERKHPGITNRLPLKHVASFLGTTNVSISRIRAGKQ